ncbi:MAG TPA: hypothetical protein VEC01_14260 [Noviherbaspirillum sp.]|uniref:hypothetical protein n=1 Tax=Noviherbaspirillum sp. TaxID=1926288 RepID=UPI002D54B00C|nr:hypothetical protein [Noviherbaspirillum sp.]HYD96489.1 hypothetical protein [Noviherbaspirillum sp.]
MGSDNDTVKEKTFGQLVMEALDIASQKNASLAVRFACLVSGIGKNQLAGNQQVDQVSGAGRARILDLCERLRVPTECKELALTMEREHAQVDDSPSFNAEEIVNLLERCDAIRKPGRFRELLTACECIAQAYDEKGDFQYQASQLLNAAADAVRRVDTGAIAKRAAADGMQGPDIGKAVHSARVEILKQTLQPGSGI